MNASITVVRSIPASIAAEADLPGADVAEQGYDFYDKAVSYNDIREDLKAILKCLGCETKGDFFI